MRGDEGVGGGCVGKAAGLGKIVLLTKSEKLEQEVQEKEDEFKF